MMNSILIYALEQEPSAYKCTLMPWHYDNGYEDILAVLQVESANVTSLVDEMEFWALDEPTQMTGLSKVKISVIGQTHTFSGNVLIIATDKATGYPRGVTDDELYWLQEYMAINDQVISDIDH